jgi:hypothetical protein
MVGSYLIIVADKAFVAKTFPKPRIFVALTLAFVFVGFAAEFAPSLANAFALLIFIALLLSHGVDIFGGAQKSLGGKAK